MKSFLEPWHMLLLILAGWINHRQQNAVDYLRTENQILKEKLGKKRILLDDDQPVGIQLAQARRGGRPSSQVTRI